MDLEDTMASLRINEGEKDTSSSPEAPHEDDATELRRSTRLKGKFSITYFEKRRVSSKPIKKGISLKENYYLDKRTKRLNSNLETIYEDSETDSYECPRKAFSHSTSSLQINKLKRTRLKSKSLSAIDRKDNKHKIPLKYLLEKLSEINDLN
ncbi:hypothetical protein TcasGA2_TC005942 [Tribolium castaneum]|uniref:Tantalus-like domain-containing protein n=1 Tax=Tribolium castaneum TaxID=7070 RepID=D6WVF8_TRICA|nr:PREDICTED: uncharacterized protein LOC103313869 [Tribolium castaneum]XP_008196477.1 PREDICTED: uncharacterized protein LOC103313869 [Tribolium castaneum]EFA08306.1 hypothetical protein TcasGA2_TC005942 [Tribolium castaneum]|eukprot:XP_008196476.1 PREDICTED: uncharacterized protein LOC103313869 [Tribolium castaneum]